MKDKFENEKRVFERKHEVMERYFNTNTMQNAVGYDVEKLELLCKEEGTTLEKYLDYARNHK